MNENKYNPSEEEMKNAEDMVGPKKAELSALREKSSQKKKEKGVDGYLESSYAEGKLIVSGRINGHDVLLSMPVTGDGKGNWLGEVDRFNLSPEETGRFIEKYDGTWARYDRNAIEAAAKEEVAPGRAEVLKDIGL